MRLRVGWETTYRYSEPVRVVHTELRVVPTQRFGQTVHSWGLTVEPEARLAASTDAFGNLVHHFDLLGSVEQVHIAMQADVETAGGMVLQPELSPLERQLALAETERCPFAPEIASLAREVEANERLAPAEVVVEILGARFAFEPGYTVVDDTALGLLQKGHGVCQDFAHLMIAMLRLRGIPARYVSGYLETGQGADATHAWVQAWQDGCWFGFDPANGCRQDERYVVTAVGRDYDDVAPIRGSYRGRAEEHWHANVHVQSQEGAQD